MERYHTHMGLVVPEQEVRGYCSFVRRQLEDNQTGALFEHVLRLVETAKTAGDNSSVLAVVRVVTEVGEAYPQALRDRWVDFVDIMLRWYLTMDTPIPTLEEIEKAMMSLAHLWKIQSSHAIQILIKLTDELNDASRVTDSGWHGEMYIQKVFTHRKIGDAQHIMRLTTVLIVIQESLEGMIPLRTADTLIDSFGRVLPSMKLQPKWVTNVIRFISCIVSDPRASTSALLPLTCKLLESQPSLTEESGDMLLYILQQLMLEESGSYNTEHRSGLLDAVQSFIKTANVQTELAFVPQFEELYLYVLKAVGGNVVAEVIHRISELCSDSATYTTSTQRVVSFLYNVLFKMLHCPETKGVAYFELLNGNQWVACLPTSAADGMKLVDKISHHVLSHLMVSPLVHTMQVVHITCSIFAIYEASEKFDTSVKLNLMEWVQNSLMVVRDAKFVLCDLSSEFVAVLQKCLQDRDAMVRVSAVKTIMVLVEVSTQEVVQSINVELYHALSVLLTDENDTVRHCAYRVFCEQLRLAGKLQPVKRTKTYPVVAPMRGRQFAILIQIIRGEHENPFDGLHMIAAETYAMARSLEGPPTSQHALLCSVITAAVRYCVTEKLKTTLGDAQATFSELEKLLKQVGSTSFLLDDNYTSFANGCNDAMKNGRTSSQAAGTALRSQLILLLLNELEKWVYLAQEGYVIEIDKRQTAWSGPSTVFFPTNRKVCDEYFSCIRLQMVAAGETMTSPLFHPMFVRSCGLRLKEMNAYVSQGVTSDVQYRVFIEMEKVLLTMSSVYVNKSACGDIIMGHLTWAERLVTGFLVGEIEEGSKLDLLRKHNMPILHEALSGMAMHADGRHEEALVHYKRVFLQSALKYSQLTVIRIVSHCYVDCCTKSLGWQELFQWVKFLKESVTNDANGTKPDAARERKVRFIAKEVIDAYESGSSTAGTQVGVAVQYAKALAEWEQGSFAECLELCVNCDEKIKVLSNVVSSKGPTFSTVPEQLSKLRILRVVAEEHLDSESVSSHRHRLVEAVDLLQRQHAIDASCNEVCLGDTLNSLISYPDAASCRRAETSLILGHKLAASCNSFPMMLLQASKEAREAGNTMLSAKLVKKLLSLPDSQEWKVSGSYEKCCLQLLSTDKGQITKGIDSLWQAGSSGKSLMALLKLHDLVLESDAFNSYLVQSAKVHPSDLAATIVRSLKTNYSMSKASMCRYAEWTMQNATNEALWAEAVRSHLAALHLPAQNDDPPLTDMKLALRVLQLLQQGSGSGFFIDKQRIAEIVQTPLRAWRDISPQLMAHLTSTSSVHHAVKQLLQKLCAEVPMLLLYPLIAALGTTKQGAPKQSFEELWDTLSAVGDAFTETKDFAAELVRVTSLLDEETNAVVASLNQSLTKVLPSYKSFVRSRLAGLGKTTAEGSGASESKFNLLKRQKFEALLQPLVQVLEKQIQKVQCPAMCLHESEFQLETLPKLQRALHELKKGLPQVSKNVDSAVEAAHTSLASVFSKLNKSLNDSERRPRLLSLSDISTQLTKLKDTAIPVPGCPQYVSITRLEQHVEVVESKTRPKKLVMWGSDGRKYTFLLKGKEDLSLDERVMQVLRTATVLLGSSHAGKKKSLRARSYAVVPLSDSSGLIRFVDNVHAVFHLHRQWMKRKSNVEQLVGSKKTKPGKASFNPVHHFFAKLLPALKEVGISNIGTRTDWPEEVLAKVFAQLSNEVPKDLLTRELWCRGSSNTTTSYTETGVVSWLERNRRYTSSLAVMSVLGYVIGLGDRHLDNMLIDFDSGETVHIDYNICFEKGMQLRVPEIVPFRLTPVLRDALGIQGVQGAYKSVCEDTMGVLRENKDTLLGLLEAFVHDPLVEWTAKRVCDPATEGMEVTVSLGVLGTHLDETLGDLVESWQKCQEAITTLAIEADQLRASKHADVVKQIQENKHVRTQLLHQVSTVKRELSVIRSKSLTEADLKSALKAFESQYERCIQNQRQFRKVQSDCQEALPSLRDLEKFPSDPVGFKELSSRVSAQLCKSFGEIKDAKLLSVLSKVDQHELKVMSTYGALKEMTSTIEEYLSIWEKNVSEIERSLDIVYSEKNCCKLWVSTYESLAGVCKSFIEKGLSATGYEEFISEVENHRTDLDRVNKAVKGGVLEHVAPVEVLEMGVEEVVQQAGELLTSLPSLELETDAMYEDYSLPEIDLSKLETTLNMSPDRTLSICYASITVLSHCSSASQAPAQVHSWERYMSLSEMEENDDPHLLTHGKWHTLTAFRKAVYSFNFVTMWLGDLVVLKPSTATSIAMLNTTLSKIDGLLITFADKLPPLLFGSPKEGATEDFVRTSLGDFQSYLLSAFNNPVMFPQDFLNLECAETLKTITDLISIGCKPHQPKLNRHYLLRRVNCVLRVFISTLVEVCLHPACSVAIDEVLVKLTNDLSLAAMQQVGRLNPDSIRPPSIGLNAQVGDLVTLVIKKGKGRFEGGHFADMRDALDAVCNHMLGKEVATLARNLKAFYKEQRYFEKLNADTNTQVLYYGWLLEPFLAQQLPNGLGSMNKRQHIAAGLDTQITQYKTLTDKLNQQLTDLCRAEFELLEELPADKKKFGMKLVQDRRFEFDTTVEHCERVTEATGKVIYLETLRNISRENDDIHNAVATEAETTSLAFDTLVRAVLVVRHNKERAKDLTTKLDMLEEQSRQAEISIVEKKGLLAVLQNQSSQATAGAYSEVIANKTMYVDHMRHIDTLVSGVLKTLTQFPTLKRLHQRVKGTSELCKRCIKGFNMWCGMFDRLWGPEAGGEEETVAGTSAVSGVEELKSVHADCLNQLEELAVLGCSDFSIEDEEGDLPHVSSDVPSDGRNLHALNVIRKVELKLQGRDIGKRAALDTPVSVTEQVNNIINEATSEKNLIHMYEGWTAWI
eukprot:TRINITY_DN1417_c1_g2_i1.p1 TRINITY_DN1417_c1_g2~~TRINITY_DN1417_c1_g2_i1.p1  ORF type:complete len:2885 (+),score=703.42 TRINITY_DN1417_c1_g2_i1:353-9007(+)